MRDWAARITDVVERHVAEGVAPGAAWILDDGTGTSAGATGTWDLPGTLPADPESPVRIASLTKAVTACLALRLAADGVLDLDAPVDRWLPELADRRVLRRPDAELDDVVPAKRPVTTIDLLTLRMGFGFDGSSSGPTPVWAAAAPLELGFGPPKPGSSLGPDAWIERFATLPLMAQPGEQWLYDTGFVVLGILLARAGNQPLEVLLRERLLDPLGMTRTGFGGPDTVTLPPAYAADEDGTLRLDDPGGAGSAYARTPALPAANGGLVSTLADYRALARMLRAGGEHRGVRILPADAVSRMTTDQLTPAQRAASPNVDAFLGDSGWGFGVGVTPDGRFGWAGYGVSFSVDPHTNRILLLATQRMPPSGPLLEAVYAAS